MDIWVCIMFVIHIEGHMGRNFVCETHGGTHMGRDHGRDTLHCIGRNHVSEGHIGKLHVRKGHRRRRRIYFLHNTIHLNFYKYVEGNMSRYCV